MSKGNKDNLQWRNIVIIAVGLVVLWLVFSQLTPSSAYRWSGGHMTGGYMGGGGYMGTYFNPGLNLEGFIYGLLLIALKVLWVLLLVGLILGLYKAFKKYVIQEENFKGFNLDPLVEKFKAKEYVCPACKQRLEEEFKFCPNCKTSLKEHCSKCGKESMPNWKCCPFCGEEQENLGLKQTTEE